MNVAKVAELNFKSVNMRRKPREKPRFNVKRGNIKLSRDPRSKNKKYTFRVILLGIKNGIIRVKYYVEGACFVSIFRFTHLEI